ncbi:MAG: hypothetical protein IPH36_22155 [Saprospiraceae bacterium]|nr:hypothetical protein [Saprospiraceae bacterium]
MKFYTMIRFSTYCLVLMSLMPWSGNAQEVWPLRKCIDTAIKNNLSIQEPNSTCKALRSTPNKPNTSVTPT